MTIIAKLDDGRVLAKASGTDTHIIPGDTTPGDATIVDFTISISIPDLTKVENVLSINTTGHTHHFDIISTTISNNNIIVALRSGNIPTELNDIVVTANIDVIVLGF
jgi:uncharacterized Zn finger protein